MSGNLRLNGATSGYSELAAPDAAGDQTFTFPATGGTLAIASNNTAGVPVPGYQQGTGSFTSNATLSKYGLLWIRIGNLVTIHGGVVVTGGQTNSTTLWLGNLPYQRAVPANGDGGFEAAASGAAGYVTYASSSNARTLLFQGGNQLLEFRSDSTAMPGENITALSGADIRFVVQYKTDNTDWTPDNGAKVDS